MKHRSREDSLTIFGWCVCGIITVILVYIFKSLFVYAVDSTLMYEEHKLNRSLSAETRQELIERGKK